MSTPQIEFYDIVSKLPNDGTWSPNTYKTRYGLNFKGIPYRLIMVEYPDIKALAEKLGAEPTSTNADGSPCYTLPIIRDLANGKVVSDSFAIAVYLEKQFPDTPTLFPAGTFALHEAYDTAFMNMLSSCPFFQLLLPKVAGVLNPPSEEYFSRTRTAKFGKPLSEVYPADTAAAWKQVETGFNQVAGWITEGEYVGGDNIVYGDIVNASFVIFVRQVFGEDSQEWKNITSWSGGRWGRLIESLYKYDV